MCSLIREIGETHLNAIYVIYTVLLLPSSCVFSPLIHHLGPSSLLSSLPPFLFYFDAFVLSRPHHCPPPSLLLKKILK